MRWIKDKLNKKKERTQCEVKWKRTRKRNETNEHKRNYRGKFDWSFEALTCVRYVLTSLGARFGGHLIFLRNTSFFSRIDRVRCRCSSFSTRQDERSRCVYSRIVTYKFSWALLSWQKLDRKSLLWNGVWNRHFCVWWTKRCKTIVRFVFFLHILMRLLHIFVRLLQFFLHILFTLWI